MTRIPFPSTSPSGPQTEVCQYCQRLVNSTDLYTCEVIGPLHGLRICIYHGSLGCLPGWPDLRGVDDVLVEALAESIREEPYGDTPWWDQNGDGFLLLESGTEYLWQEDGAGSGLQRERAAT